MSEERDQDLNEEEGISMEDSREDHCRDVAEDGENKKKIRVLRWEVYSLQKIEGGFDKERFFGVRSASKGGGHCLDLCEGYYHCEKGAIRSYWTIWV